MHTELFSLKKTNIMRCLNDNNLLIDITKVITFLYSVVQGLIYGKKKRGSCRQYTRTHTISLNDNDGNQ